MNKSYQFPDPVADSSDPNPDLNPDQNILEENALLPDKKRSQADSSLCPDQAAYPDQSASVSAPSETRSSRPPLRWFLVWFLLSCGLGGLSAFAFFWLTAIPPATDCQNISPLSSDMERLHCAQEAAQSGELPELIAGLELVETWTPAHPLYNEANRWMAEWSNSVLGIARQRMTQNDLEGALELANRIPPTSPLYTETQATIAQWQEVWQQGETLFNQAQEALKQQDWDLAYAKIFELRDHPYDYWRTQQANTLSEQVQTEKQARRILAEATSIAQIDNPQQLVAATERLRQIDRNTHTWVEAQPALKQWGESLLIAGGQRWQEKQFDEAIAFAESAKLSADLLVDAENLVKLSQSRQMAISSGSQWKVTPQHLWSMMEAVAAVRQIQPDSRFYAQAQASLESWDAQLQDMLQLQYAQVTASLGNRDAVETAIAQAKQIDFNRPRRLQAQTLIAHWQQEAERLEDQPILFYAQKLAEPETLAALKTAIAQVNQIPFGRVLHGEAQGLAYAWGQKVEVLEDEPFLTLAQSQARQGLLREAIQTASVIRSGRALYSRAQAAIGNWQAQIIEAEQPRDRTTRQASDSVQEERSPETRSAIVEPAPSVIEPANQPNEPAEPFPLPSPAHQLPRTIEELMRTHPRPVADRLTPSELLPTPNAGAERTAPPANPVTPTEAIPPEPIPAPIAEPSLESQPNAEVEAVPPRPFTEEPAPSVEPSVGEWVIEPIEETPPLTNPAIVPAEDSLPLSEEGLQLEPLSGGSTVPSEAAVPANDPLSTNLDVFNDAQSPFAEEVSAVSGGSLSPENLVN